MLSFRFKKAEPGRVPDELDIVVDEAGLKSLLAQLHFLEMKRTDHVHLMSEAWGGTHLQTSDDDLSIHKVTIHKV